MKEKTKAKHIEVGEKGELEAQMFLVKQGFSIIATNFRKKYGEIDIIAEREGILHFIEVKSVSRESINNNVIHETYRPEEMVHKWKLQKISRVIETILLRFDREISWQFDVITVVFYKGQDNPEVSFIKDIIIEG